MTYQPIAISEEMHRKAKTAAASEGLSLKEWTERAIRAALTDNGKRLVDSKAPYSTEFIKDSGILQTASIQKALARLIDLGIIFVKEKEYRFINPFFRSWLLEKRY